MPAVVGTNLRKFQIFVSSTYLDLVKERQDAIKAIVDLGHMLAGMEGFPAIDMKQFEYIKKVIDQCDYYVLIIGDRYGSVAPDAISFTEKEYHYAIQTGQIVLAFVKNDGNPQGDDVDEKLGKFKADVMSNRLVHRWNVGDDLKYPVLRSLQTAFEQHPRVGWVRADQAKPELLHQASWPFRHWMASTMGLLLLSAVGIAVGGALYSKHEEPVKVLPPKPTASSEIMPPTTSSRNTPATASSGNTPPTASPASLSPEDAATKLSIWESVSTSNHNALVAGYNAIDLAQSRWTQLIKTADGKHQLYNDLVNATAVYMAAATDLETLRSAYPMYQDISDALAQPYRAALAKASSDFSNAVLHNADDLSQNTDSRLRPLAGALRREMDDTVSWLNDLQRTATTKRQQLSDVK